MLLVFYCVCAYVCIRACVYACMCDVFGVLKVCACLLMCYSAYV